jgi:uncharacterized peroxidase-related enzyme
VEAHGADLQAEVQEQKGGEELTRAVMKDYRGAELSPADRAMLDYVAKLSLSPQKMEPGDVDALREHGFGDEAIHEIAQITGLFAYYNRIADGLGIDPEP